MRCLVGLAALAAAGAAAARDRQPPPPPPPPKGPVEYLESLLPWTTVEQPADFVRATRPAREGEFMPAGELPEASGLKIKTDAELAAAKAEFESMRSAHDAIKAHPPALTTPAAAPPPPPPPPPPVAQPKPTSKVAKRRAKPRAVAAAPAN